MTGPDRQRTERNRERNRADQRRWRERAKAGVVVVQIEIAVEDAEALIAGKLLSPGETDDRRAIAEALRRLLQVLRNCRQERA